MALSTIQQRALLDSAATCDAGTTQVTMIARDSRSVAALIRAGLVKATSLGWGMVDGRATLVTVEFGFHTARPVTVRHEMTGAGVAAVIGLSLRSVSSAAP
jgi:hypothetical protein